MRPQFSARNAVFLILAAAFFLAGCTDNNGDFVFNDSRPQGFTLRVAADPAALARGAFLGQITTNTTQFRVTLFDLNSNQVGQQTVPRGGTAVFTGLPQGLYVVRMEGLDAGSNVVGYFDQLITFLSSDLTTLIPGLRITNTPPAPDPTGSGSPFFLFTGVPTAATGGTAFSVTAQVFSATGAPVTSATNGVSLVSNNLAFVANPANQNTNANGIVTFSGLEFPSNTTGTTTFTVDATGVDAANSNTTTVSPAATFFERVSVDAMGTQANGSSAFPDVSSDGRFVAFQAEASNLVPNDTNMRSDSFVYDRTNNTIENITVNSNGDQGNMGGNQPSISSDGRYVAFTSRSTNLVTPDTNGANDVFVYDRTNNTVERVSVDSGGVEGNGASGNCSISDDGRYVAFASDATNLAPGGVRGVYLHDRDTNTTTRLSVNETGTAVNGNSGAVAISGNGQAVAFRFTADILATDTNGEDDVYVRDLSTNTTEIVSVNNAGDEGDAESIGADISRDGRYVSFTSLAANLVTPDGNADYDIFVFDRTTDTVERISQSSGGTLSNGSSFSSNISADGRFVTFESSGTNLVTPDTNGRQDIFVHDRTTNRTSMVSVTPGGTQSDQGNQDSAISADGRTIVFQTDSDVLITGDTNGTSDIIARDNPLP